MVDLPFINFAFPATGAPTNRTMPDRLAEVKNILDFGADPSGGNPSITTPAIQAAVDSISGANRGVIYFPLGQYQTNAPITFNYDGDLSICFRGEFGSNVFGNFNGYIFDRHFTPVSVTITIPGGGNPGVVTETSHGRLANAPVKLSTTGALPTGLLPGVTYYIKTVLSSSTYTLSATPGGTVIATTGSQSGTHKRIANNTIGGKVFEKMTVQNGHASGGGIRIGSTDGAAIRDSVVSAFICITTEDSVGVSSNNISIENVVCSNGGGTVPGSHYIIIGGAGSIQCCTLSGADTAVRAYGGGLSISACRSENCNTSYLFGLDSAGTNVGIAGFSMMACSTEGCWTSYDLAGTCSGFIMTGCGALGHDLDNAGVVKFIKGTEYGLRIRSGCKDGILQSCTLGGDFDSQAAIAIENASSRGNMIIREVSAIVNQGGGDAWRFPTNAYTATFVNNNQLPLWTYSQLPTGGNVLEGDEYDITDSTTAIWGANVTTGGGSNRVKVRYNNTNWTVVGK